MAKRDCPDKLVRMAAQLQEFRIKGIEYIERESNILADTLSRIGIAVINNDPRHVDAQICSLVDRFPNNRKDEEPEETDESKESSGSESSSEEEKSKPAKSVKLLQFNKNDPEVWLKLHFSLDKCVKKRTGNKCNSAYPRFGFVEAFCFKFIIAHGGLLILFHGSFRDLMVVQQHMY
ncbi:hypothetical protein BLOT_009841 [Blomia tropicalis]|nr:hypothetical protein BLOT_016488 [Blomia tropicalis]KAI2802394.1 hypothetical protein BLOT_009841 [Blomia tropicalis]